MNDIINIEYIWINNWRSFNNTEINFSSKYNFRYSVENEYIECQENSNYYSNFYNKNINMSVLVGKNGVGKTSILEFLMYLCSGTDPIYEKIGNFIVGYEFNKNIIMFYYGIKLKCNNNRIQLIEINNNNHNIIGGEETWQKIRNDMQYIYYSGALNSITYEYRGQKLINLSFNLIKAAENCEHSINILKQYWIETFKKQILFVSNNSKIVDNFNVKYPDEITVFIQRNRNINNWINNNNTEYKLIEKKFDFNNSENYFDKELALEIAISLRDDVSFMNYYDRHDFKEKNPLEFIKNCIFEIINSENEEYYRKWIDFIDYYLSSVKKSRLNILVSGISGFKLKTLDSSGKVNFVVIKEFINKYEELGMAGDFLGFSWNISSGENVLLNFYSELSYLSKHKGKLSYLPKEGNDKQNESNAIILLDEVEISLHPEWQRIFINSLLNFLPKIYSGTNLQIIIATHSPIVLSDVLKQDVVYLQKENGITKADDISRHKETFGSNIYSLYDDAFFLDNGLIGEFAREKIVALLMKIDDVNSNNNNIDSIEKDIEIIGDNLLRESIEKSLRNKIKKDDKN